MSDDLSTASDAEFNHYDHVAHQAIHALLDTIEAESPSPHAAAFVLHAAWLDLIEYLLDSRGAAPEDLMNDIKSVASGYKEHNQ